MLGPPLYVLGPPLYVLGPPLYVLGPPLYVLGPPLYVLGPPLTGHGQMNFNLYITTLWVNSVEDKVLIFFLFFQKTGYEISCKLSSSVKYTACTLNSFGAKFQTTNTTFVICIFILTNYRLERYLYVKLKD